MRQERLSRRTLLAAGSAGLLAARAWAGECAAPHERLAFDRNVPVGKPYDVVVCGGGPAGIAAALAARRNKAKVLLVEGQGQLGGTGISSLVSHWLGGRSSDCRRWVVGGVFRELSEEAAGRGIALIPTPDPGNKYQPHGWYRGQLAAGIPFDPFGMAALLDEKLLAAGVDLLLLTQVVDAVVQDGRITHVILFNKSGLSAVPATAVIDATGDADVAARSGCEVVKGREEDGLTTPASLIFHVDGVDQDALDAYIHEHNCPRFRNKIAELRAAGEWTFPYDIFISVQLEKKGTMMINTTRLVGVDGTGGRSKTDGMVRGRAEVQRLMALMRKHFPGFGEARIKAVAPLLGVRETRRIKAEYQLSVGDLAAGKEFDDTIGFSAYGWDLPDPKLPSHNPGHGRKRELTPIPYRVMVARPVENLVCPGRAISVERPVLGPLRVMAPCMAMGEAAGEAAALVLRRGVPFAAIDTAALRDKLRTDGAIVDQHAADAEVNSQEFSPDLLGTQRRLCPLYSCQSSYRDTARNDATARNWVRAAASGGE
jgi:hypothetical protein